MPIPIHSSTPTPTSISVKSTITIEPIRGKLLEIPIISDFDMEGESGLMTKDENYGKHIFEYSPRAACEFPGQIAKQYRYIGKAFYASPTGKTDRLRELTRSYIIWIWAFGKYGHGPDCPCSACTFDIDSIDLDRQLNLLPNVLETLVLILKGLSGEDSVDLLHRFGEGLADMFRLLVHTYHWELRTEFGQWNKVLMEHVGLEPVDFVESNFSQKFKEYKEHEWSAWLKLLVLGDYYDLVIAAKDEDAW